MLWSVSNDITGNGVSLINIYKLSNSSLTVCHLKWPKGKSDILVSNTFKPDALVFVRLVEVELVLKTIWFVPVIFKLDNVEPAKIFILCNDYNILTPETVNELENILLLLHDKSIALLEEKSIFF